MNNNECYKCGSIAGLTNLHRDVYLCDECRKEFERKTHSTIEKDPVGPYDGVDFTQAERGVFEERSEERAQWMGAVGKQGFAPWADRDHPEAEEDKDARWKWSIPNNWADKETVDNWLDKHPKLTGYAFILQKEHEPYNDDADNLAFVDGDDVRCPETGEVHPGFIEVMEDLGETYVDVSSSGSGLHAIYVGKLPEDIRQVKFELDDEPWGENEETPGVEIYDGKRICISTGKHIVGTPTKANEWDQNVLDYIIEEHVDEDERQTASYDTDSDRPDMEDYTPSAVGDEETSDIRDVFYAVEDLEPRDVSLRTNQVGVESTGWEMWDPNSYRPSSGGDSLHYNPGENVFYDQKAGQSFGVLGLYAAENGIIRKPWSTLKGEDWWETIELLRDDEGIPIPTYSPEEGRNVSPVDVKRIERMDHQDRRRFARRHGVKWPSVDDVRERLKDSIESAMMDKASVVIRSPTGSGKSYTVSTNDWREYPEITGEQPVVQALPTRKARDEAYENACEQLGAENVTRLKGRKELCPIARGEHDGEFNCPKGMKASEYIDMLCDKVGLPFSVVHQWMNDFYPEPELPCERGDTECPSKGQFDNVPRDDDSGRITNDVIVCTHKFLFVPSLRMHTNVVIDEQPKFRDSVNPERVKRAINLYLKESDAPFSHYNQLTQAAREGTIGSGQLTFGGETIGEEKMVRVGDESVIVDAVRDADPYTVIKGIDADKLANYTWGKDEDREPVSVDELPDLLEESSDSRIKTCLDVDDFISACLDQTPKMSWFRDNPQAHAMAPAFCRAIWESEKNAYGRYCGRVPYHPPRFDSEAHDSEAWNRVFVDVVIDDDMEIKQAITIPDFSLTESLIGLDAHAQPDDPWWRVDVDENIETRRVLSEEEEALYRRYERGLFTVQVGDSVQPVASGEYLEGNQGDRMDSLVAQLRSEYGDQFNAGISSVQGESYLQESMAKHGCDQPKTMHYGEEESRNDFAGEKVGLVFGSHDFGDEPVLNIASRLGLNVEPEMIDCPHCDGGDLECGKCNHNGKIRAVGRGFVGRHGGDGEKILQGWRERHVAQSVGRWARDAEDPDDSAVVYVATNTLPDNFVDAQVPGVTWMATDDQAERFEYVLNSENGATTAEIAEATGCDKSTAYRTMKRLAQDGKVECHKGEGRHGAHIYDSDDTEAMLAEVDIHDDGEIIAPHVRDTYTWTASITANVGYDGDGGDEYDEANPSLTRFTSSGPPDTTAD